MRALQVWALLCFTVSCAQKFTLDDVYKILPKVKPNDTLSQFVDDLNAADPKAQKALCATWIKKNVEAPKQANKTADCLKIASNLVNVTTFMDHIFEAIQNSTIIGRRRQKQLKRLFYAEDEKYHHDTIPSTRDWMERAKEVVPEYKWEALNATIIAASQNFERYNAAISNALNAYHHPYDKDFFDKH